MSSRPDSDMIELDEARDLVIVLDSGIDEMGTTERLARSLVAAYEDRDRTRAELDAAIDLCNAAMTAGLAECGRLRSIEESTSDAFEEADRDRNYYQDIIDKIHHATGCEREWSNLHSCAECAVENVGNALTELDRRRAEVKSLTSECERLRAEVSALRDERKTQGETIIKLCDDINRMSGAQRPGQAFYNALYAIDPVFAESVRNTDADPFNVRGDGVEIIARALSAWREHLTTSTVTPTTEGTWHRRAEELLNDKLKLTRKVARLEIERTKLKSRNEKLEKSFDEILRMTNAVSGIYPEPDYPRAVDAMPAQEGWSVGGLDGPATVCEPCKGDEVSGCICGMVPGTEPRR